MAADDFTGFPCHAVKGTVLDGGSDDRHVVGLEIDLRLSSKSNMEEF